MKSKILFLTVLILFACSFIHAQEESVKSISVRFGVSNLLGDIGNDQRLSNTEELLKMDGQTYGIAYHFNSSSRWTFGPLLQYSFLKESDIRSDNVTSTQFYPARFAGYYYRSHILEFGFHTEYRIFTLFKGGDTPVNFYLGCLPEYFYSNGHVFYVDNDEEVLDDLYGFVAKENIHSMIIYPTFRMSFQFQKIDVGIYLEYGFSFSDNLDHYTNSLSEHNDKLFKFGLSVMYKL